MSVASQDNEEVEPPGVERTDSVTAHRPCFSRGVFLCCVCVCVLMHVHAMLLFVCALLIWQVHPVTGNRLCLCSCEPSMEVAGGGQTCENSHTFSG